MEIAESVYRTIFVHSQDVINLAEWDPKTGEKRLVTMNPKYIELSGCSEEELLLDNLYEKRVSSYTEQEEQDDAGRWGEPVRGSFTRRRPDDVENYLEFTSIPLTISDHMYILGIDREKESSQIYGKSS